MQDEGFGRAATWPFCAGVRQAKAGRPFGPGTVTVGVGTTEPLADCGCGDGIDLGRQSRQGQAGAYAAWPLVFLLTARGTPLPVQRAPPMPKRKLTVANAMSVQPLEHGSRVPRQSLPRMPKALAPPKKRLMGDRVANEVTRLNSLRKQRQAMKGRGSSA